MKTIKIEAEKGSGCEYVVINECDFDAKKHVKFGENKAVEKPAQKIKKKNK